MKCSPLPMRKFRRNRVMKCSPVPCRMQHHAELSITWQCKAMHCTDCCSLSTHARNQVSTAWDFLNCVESVRCSSFFMMNLYNSKQCRYTRSLSMYCESMSDALNAVVSPSPDHPKAFADFSYSKDTLSAVTNLDHCPLWRNQSQSFAERATMT